MYDGLLLVIDRIFMSFAALYCMKSDMVHYMALFFTKSIVVTFEFFERYYCSELFELYPYNALKLLFIFNFSWLK